MTIQTSAGQPAAPRYTMKISRLTVDKLGVKLYDKVSAVIAELVANAYDADATEVLITAPMGELLATQQQNVLQDKGYQIEVKDNGIGMTPDQINEFYLRVGAERRRDSRRGDRSQEFKRKVMGRKGVGKLAPFGICERVEIISAGGEVVQGLDQSGSQATGYLTAHLVLNRSAMLLDEDADYLPDVGNLDGVVSPDRGTTIIMSDFNHRFVPEMEEFTRQLSQRFGLASSNWSIRLFDLLKNPDHPDYSKAVGGFAVEKMAHTELRFVLPPASDTPIVQGPDGNIIQDLRAGFYVGTQFYPVIGWVGYSKENYKDDLMAGVRIYCHGKIASQTALFDLKSGFTGEYDMRSYFIGELHADWLDEQDDDLIQTDRRDILWSHELGEAFQKWGQEIVKRVGRMTRNPMRETVWEVFRQTSLMEQKIAEAYPRDDMGSIRDNALQFAKLIGKTMRSGEAQDPEQVKNVVQMSLFLAPHITLDEELKKAAEASNSPLQVIAGFLKTARVAELSSYGRIAYERIRVIEKIEALKNDNNTNEAAIQETIAQCPWLIDPQWSPITANQAFSTLKKEFVKFYKNKTGVDINLDDFSMPSKRADFVLSDQSGIVQIIEIKRPSHRLEDTELDRIINYIRMMREFLGAPNHTDFSKHFHGFHVTLVCDGTGLSQMAQEAFKGLVSSGVLTEIDWTTFLFRTKKMHQEFLDESERQTRMDVAAVGPPSITG